jgi:DNA-binding MarR family transcriptional regulator
VRGLVAIPKIERAAHAVALHLSAHVELDVTQAEAHVLSYLHDRASARINEIHTAFGHRRSTLTSVLDRLESRRLLTRETDPDDRRTVVVTLTQSGVALGAKIGVALQELERRALRDCSAAELATFVRVLDRFAAATGPGRSVSTTE